MSLGNGFFMGHQICYLQVSMGKLLKDCLRVRERRSIIVTPQLRSKHEMNWEVIYSKQQNCRCKDLKAIEEMKSRMDTKGWD